MIGIVIRLLILLAIPTACIAQATVSTSGGDATGSGGTVSYSIGQVAFIHGSGTGGSAQEGVQQPFELSQVHVPESMDNIQLSIFPNPAQQQLSIHIPAIMGRYTLTVLNNVGAVIETHSLLSTLTSIEIGHLSNAVYYIEITDSNKISSRYKLIKN